jgi:PHP family Zn ribbon phosphoesterase
MRPIAIVKQAKKKGLDVIAICDHNSARNVWVVRSAGRRQGLAVIGGMEICSEEEVHILGLFDKDENLRQMQQLVDENLSGENNAELFGEQWLCDEQDIIVGQESKLLIGATKLSVKEITENIHSLGGLAVFSHVDRESYSILSQLGFVPEGLEIDVLEISPRCSPAEARDCLPQIKDYRLVHFSDAHQLDQIGVVSTTFTADSPSVMELGKALRAEDGREVVI